MPRFVRHLVAVPALLAALGANALALSPLTVDGHKLRDLAPLFSYRGGSAMCGPRCRILQRIETDGRYLSRRGYRGLRLGKLPEADFDRLKAEVAKADYAAIKRVDFPEPCPRIMDASSASYGFNAPGGYLSLRTCNGDSDSRSTLFKAVRKVQADIEVPDSAVGDEAASPDPMPAIDEAFTRY